MTHLKKRLKWLHSTALVACGCLLALSTQAAKYPDTAQYTIRRKGKKVGIHSVKFSNNDTGLNVNVESNITITILKVPVFRFNYVATEQWADGKLSNVSARTNHGGDITNAAYTPNSDSAYTYSSNHWNADVLSATEVFNTLTGKMSKISIDRVGSEILQDKNTSISANRYRYTGDIQADVWYDDDERWVKLEFKGEDGSVISYTANPLNFAQ